MAKLSGRWTITATENEAGWKQRILISGSNSHDGGHVMVVGTRLEHVEGDEISIKPQAFNPSTNVWITSKEQERFGWDDKVGLTCTIAADDNPVAADGDFNDLVVLCVAEDDDLVTPHTGPGPDLTIPKSMIRSR